MIITITNNKGGTGKSTTAQTLSIGLSLKGKKVLLIDFDPQANTTKTFNLKNSQNTITDVLSGKCNISDAIYQCKGIDIIPTNNNLLNIEIILNSNKEYEFTKYKQLKMHLQQVSNYYDYIIIDTAPNLSLLTTNAIYSSDYVLIPLLADIYSIEGLATINTQINKIKQGTDNQNVKISGLLITHYKAQTIVNQYLKDQLNNIARQLDTKIYKNVIRDSVVFSDSQASNDVCLLKYPTHNASADYIGFIQEFLNDMEGNKNG